jgi:glycosyltransferase involved in cell wall biosynthesis
MESETRPLSIAFLGDTDSIHLHRWAGWFAARGHRVTLLVPEGREIPFHLDAGIAVERYPLAGGRPLRGLALISSSRSVRRAIARVRPDVLHVHYLTIHGARAWLSGFHPYVVTVWGNDVLITTETSRKARILAGLSLRSADLVTGISNHVLDAAVRLGARPDRCRRVHFGVDVERFAPAPGSDALRASLGLGSRRIVFSPRIIAPLYRHDVVIDAVAQLPDDVALVMVRYLAEAPEMEALERRIEERGLAGRSIILPSVPYSDMPDYYRLADVVVSVPESDAGPMTLVEALAVGKPTVSSDLPPVREWLADLDPACLVPVGDSAATARAIAAVLARSPQQRDEAARLGRARVLEWADQRRTMAEMEVLYRRLAAGQPVSGAIEPEAI